MSCSRKLSQSFVCCGFVLLFLAVPVRANEPPTAEQIAQYKADGTWAERLANAYAIGNHKAAPGLAEHARWRVEQLMRQAEGLPALRTPPPAWQGGLPTSGSPKVLVLLVDFPDWPHYANQTQADVYDKFFQDGVGNYPYESVRNYFERASYDTLHIQGNVLGWYRAQHNRSYYEAMGMWYANEAVIMEALDYFNAQGHDFTQYDNDGNGTIDTLYCKWTGPIGDWATLWWAYQTSWWVNSSYRIDGKRINTYVWSWIADNQGDDFDPHTDIHETGHALGVPDYYDYDPDVGPGGGLGGLDMQDDNVGDWNCFSKFLVDWLTPTTIVTGSQTLTLNPSGTSQDCVLIMPGAVPGQVFDEYFMAQYRKGSTGNDPATYPTGYAIWHVDATLDVGGTDFLYDNSYTGHKLLRRMEADGLEEIETGNGPADAGDFYVPPTVFGPTTFPSSHDYTGAPTTVLVDQLTTPGATMGGRFRFFGAQAAGATLVAEGCTPGNLVLDPAETVTVSFALHNFGPAMTNLVATLLPTGGVIAPSGPQSYGALATNATASRSFSFTAGGTCGGTLTATLALQDGANVFAPGTYTFTLGALRLSENFDGVTPPALPAGWVAARPTGTVALWATTAAAAQTTPNSAFAALPTEASDNRLTSPTWTIQSSGARLAFWHKYELFLVYGGDNYVGYEGGVLEISISGGAFTDILTAGGTFATNGYTYTLADGFSNPLSGRQAWSGSSGGFIETVVNLPAGVVGNTVAFRWRLGSTFYGGQTGWWVDSIRILNDNVCCQTADTGACCFPDGWCADVTEAPCTQGGGLWHAGTTCATYECPQPAYACCVGYPRSCVELTAAQCAARGGTFHVGSTCASVTCEQPYCAVSRLNQGFMYVSRVTVGTIDNVSGDSTNGYADYTSLSTNMLPGVGYAITVKDGPPWWSADQCGVWVDWNRNGTFDPNELVTMTGPGSSGQFTGTITPPVGTPPGPARMRIQILYYYTPTPCGTISYGETEDYTINMTSLEGACCIGGACSITTQAACTGTWKGPGTDCFPNPCAPQDYWLQVVSDVPTDQGGTGYHQQWYSYPLNWWNQWWPNEFALDREKEVTLNFDTQFTGDPPVVAVNYAAETWSNPDAPPLSWDDQFVVRVPVDPPITAPGQYTRITRLPFCPRWVSMDVQGTDFVIQGTITHVCLPPALGACCMPDGSCSQTTQANCVAGGVWHSEWMSCQPNLCPQSGCKGDTNCDGGITFADIDPFVEALAGESAWNVHHPSCPWLNADCNNSGTVTFADIDPFVAVIGRTCP